MDFKSYFEELKRRKVFKTIIAYIAAAWIIAQITADVLPIFEIPPFVQQAIIIILIVGFPAVLIFAWIYDVTPEGIRKTERDQNAVPEGHKKIRKLNTVIIFLLSIAVFIMLYDQFNISERASSETQTLVANEDTFDRSVAVLPFKNWSGDSDMEYVSDGIADEITTNLEDIKELDKVIAFRQTLKYKYLDLDLQQISDSLDVRFILDGSIQLSGDKIRVKVQLLDGKTNEYYWKEDFTTNWDTREIFTLQNEVTRRVVEKMDKEVGEDAVVFEKQLPTENTEAYEYYLKGLYQDKKGSQQGTARSIEFFSKAIELDSTFIQAYKSLSNSLMESGLFNGVIEQRDSWRSSKKYIEKVLEISKDENDLIWATQKMRANSYFFEWDFDLMEKEYLQGFDDNSYLMKTLYEINTGRYEAALKTAKSQADLHPSCGVCQAYLANALFFAGKTEDAKTVIDLNFELFNDNYRFLREAALLSYYLGAYEMSQEALRAIKFTFNDNSPTILFLIAVNHNVNGDSYVEKETLEILFEQYQNQNSGSPAWNLAKYYAHTGEYENSITWLQRSFERHDVEMIWLRTEPLFAPLRKDSRYLEIYKNVGFPVPPAVVPEDVSRTIQ
jgi:TolB-like protein